MRVIITPAEGPVTIRTRTIWTSTKVQQKISGTSRSEKGADWFWRIRGYISTVRKNDRPVFASIKDIFEGKPFIPTVSQ
jgi:hypothetical protein